jgi:hypothetical protein
VKLVLAISIDPCGEPLTETDLDRIVSPDRLRLGGPAVFVRAGERWAGRLVLEGEPGDCQHDAALHLIALRGLSARLPAAAITIDADPGGGALVLRAGSFGDDEEEVAELVTAATGLAFDAEAPRRRLYASFRVEPDAHDHLLALLDAALPPGATAPVVDSSASAVALGFEVDHPRRPVELVAMLGLVWRQQGSGPSCLIELEGDPPVKETVESWADWVQLEWLIQRACDERPAREAPAEPEPVAGEPRAPARPQVWGTPLATHPATRKVLGPRWLSWIDGEGRILCLAHGELVVLSERTELGTSRGAFRRRAGDALRFRDGRGAVVELPAPARGAERLLHGIYNRSPVFGATMGLFSDTVGDPDTAETRLRLVHAKGVFDGPRLARLRAVEVVAERKVYALSEIDGEVMLSQIDLEQSWTDARARPWDPGVTATDMAVIEQGHIAVTATRGSRSWLYLVERPGLVQARKIALPCVQPQIVCHDQAALWITGLLPPPGPPRCELFRVELRAGAVTVLTAELPDASTLDVAGPTRGGRAREPAREREQAPGCLVATPHAVLHATPSGLQHVFVLRSGERVTSMIYDTPWAIFFDGPRGPRLVLGHGDAAVSLSSPGYEARFLSPTDEV